MSTRSIKLEQYDGREQKIILTGLIVNEDLLREVSDRFESDLFPDRWSNLICSWCVQYYNKYKKAPGTNINNVFRRWANKTKDKPTTELIDDFLTGLTGEYKKLKREIHADEVLDLALEYFNKTKLSRTKDQIEQFLEMGSVTDAQKVVSEFKPLDKDPYDFVNPYLDTKLHETVIKSKIRSLIKFPGPLGQFFGDSLARENFIAFQGAEKAGKSFWLQEMAHQAARCRLRVVFFGIGDMSLKQTIRRYQSRLSRRPVKKVEYYKPIGWKSKNADGDILPRRKKMTAKEPITVKEVEAARKKFQTNVLRSDRDLFKLSCQPAMSLDMIRRKIIRLGDKENWVPDVIIIDYADLLEAPIGVRDKLDQIDDNWRRMRNLAIEFHTLVITATQVKRTAYRKRWMSLDDVADQKKKAAHITHLIGINCSELEEEKEVRRLDMIRTRDPTPRKRVTCAGCLALSNPCVLSI